MNQYKIEGLTIAVSHMDEMLSFYSGVFGIEFQENNMHGALLYSGVWGDLRLLFCPAEIAGIDVNRNRQQFDIVVENLEDVVEKAMASGGRRLGDIQESEAFKSAGVYDPDGNSIVFKQYF